jgi:hypothetical protein
MASSTVVIMQASDYSDAVMSLDIFEHIDRLNEKV